MEIAINCKTHGPNRSLKDIPCLVGKEIGIWEVSLEDMYCDNFSVCRDTWYITVKDLENAQRD